MDRLQLPHAKLFYYAAELYKSGEITENEKLKLKEMVINDEPQIFEILEQHQQNNNYSVLTNKLLILLRPSERQTFEKNIQQALNFQSPVVENTPENQQEFFPAEIENYDEILKHKQILMNQNATRAKEEEIRLNPYSYGEELSSPLGQQLLKRKRKKEAQTKQHDVKEYLKPYSTMNE